MKPNLFIVGAPKCGTTAWVRYLGSHPDVFFSQPKEPHYFTTDAPARRIVRDEASYLGLFEEAGSAKVVGEGSTSYLYSPVAAENIRGFQPDAKILAFVRDQEEFLPSWHNQLFGNQTECIADFERAWRLSEERDGTNVSKHCRDITLLNYKACGRFAEQLERFRDHFPAARIRVFHFRDWAANPRAAYLEILRFLALEDDGRTDFPRVNEAGQPRLRSLESIVKRPPRSAIKVAEALKRVAGVSSLGILDTAARLNSRPGYVSKASAALKEEIRSYYAKENALLERHLWRAPDTDQAARLW